MIKKGNRLYSIIHFKCPRCHEHDLFLPATYFDFNKLGKVYDECPNCDQDLRIEIGFYWGALYVAYGLSVFTSLTQFLIYFLVFNMSITTSFILFIAVQILISPYVYKLSKAIWVNIFVGYDKNQSHARGNAS